MEKQLAEEAMANLDLSAPEDLEKSNRLRINGNALYKAGKLQEAISLYHRAAGAAPSNALPLSNLSAAYFEVGNYVMCTEHSLECLDKDKMMKNKVLPRLIKSYLHLRAWDDAREALDIYEIDPEEKQQFCSLIDQAKAVWSVWSASSDEGELDLSQLPLSLFTTFDLNRSPSAKQAKKRLFLELPRYKVKILDQPLEYFPVGHDSARSLFSFHVENSRPRTLFFAGVGDGRNLFVTLISIAKEERGSKTNKPYHITMNDINANCLARVIVIMSLAEELADAGTPDESKRVTTLATLYCVFIGVAMPAKVFAHLQATLDRIIKTIQSPEQPFRIDVRSCRAELLRCLLSWRYFKEEVLPVSKVLKHHASSQFPGDTDPKLPGVKREHKIWQETGTICPPAAMGYEASELKELMQETKQPPNKSLVKAYVENNWKPNVTLVDFDSYPEFFPGGFDLSFNPFDVVDKMYWESDLEQPSKSPHLFEHILPLFEEPSKAWAELKGKLTLEALQGDIVQIAETFQHKVAERPEGYPNEYGRLHLSNIPDYIGGFLTTSIHISKIVAPGFGNFTTGTCMLNAGVWNNISQYHREYSLLTNEIDVVKAFHVQHFPAPGETPEIIPGICGPLAWYQFWWRPRIDAHEYFNLLPREVFKRWVFNLFFKLYVPADQRNTPWTHIVLQPLNISIFFRVLMHLHEIGYPGHWLSDILVSILENKVLSAARLVRTCPVTSEELERKNSVKRLSTSPYLSEMRTLTVFFQRILPFAVLTPLPSPKSIHNYSLNITIKKSRTNSYEIPNALLIFYRSDLMEEIGASERGMHDLLNPIVDGSKESSSKEALKLYEEGLVTVSVWEWDPKKGVASFWMVGEDAERLEREEGDWRFGVWGTVLWEAMHARGSSVIGNLTKGEAWFA